MGNYTQLSITDRRRLSVFLEMGLPIKEIATKLDKNRATIYREVKRNKGSEKYCGAIAHQKAKERSKENRANKLKDDGILRDYVVRSLKKGWSPEQISGRMKHQKLSFYVCHETIYHFILSRKKKNFFIV